MRLRQDPTNTLPIDIMMTALMVIYIMNPSISFIWWVTVIVFSLVSLAEIISGAGGLVSPKRMVYSLLTHHYRTYNKPSLKPLEDIVEAYEKNERHIASFEPATLTFICIAIIQFALLSLICNPLFYIRATAFAIHKIGLLRIYRYAKTHMDVVGAAMCMMILRETFSKPRSVGGKNDNEGADA